MRVDPNIDFVWWDTAPFEDLPQARFAIRWRVFSFLRLLVNMPWGEAFTGFKLMVDGQVVAEGRIGTTPGNSMATCSSKPGNLTR